MLRLYTGKYNYLRLKFLDKCINPPCDKFDVLIEDRSCKYCEYKQVCLDLSRLIRHINELCDKKLK